MVKANQHSPERFTDVHLFGLPLGVGGELKNLPQKGVVKPSKAKTFRCLQSQGKYSSPPLLKPANSSKKTQSHPAGMHYTQSLKSNPDIKLSVAHTIHGNEKRRAICNVPAFSFKVDVKVGGNAEKPLGDRARPVQSKRCGWPPKGWVRSVQG